MTSRETEILQFLASAGWSDATRAGITGDASSRRYERLRLPDGNRAVLMNAPPETAEDVRRFVLIGTCLRQQGLSAPTVLAEEADKGFLLLEDLGDDLFYDLMAKDTKRQNALYRAAIDTLLHLRSGPIPEIGAYDAAKMLETTNLFFEWYPHTGSAQDQSDFAALFRKYASRLDDMSQCLVLRDYHAQNLIWLPDRAGVARVGLLDFQDALRGHPAYDLVSVLQDARRDVPPEIEKEMLQYYLDQTGEDGDAFQSAYALLGMQRNMRILGVFVRLWRRDHKVAYIDLIPRVDGLLRRNLADPALAEFATILLPLLPEPDTAFLDGLRQ